MAALYGFFDESGKPHQQPVVVFSGFLATWEQWEMLSDDWQRLLRVYNMPVFHFKDVKQRTSVVKKFIGAIKQNVELGISFAINVDDFNQMPSHIKQYVGQSADFLAFKAVVFAMRHHVDNEPGNVIHFTCDEDEKRTIDCYKWYKDIKRDPKLGMKEKLVSFCVGDDKFLPQLQASDLFAGLNRIEAERRLLGTVSDAQELFDELAKPEQGSKLGFHAVVIEKNGIADLARSIEEEEIEELFLKPPEGLT